MLQESSKFNVAGRHHRAGRVPLILLVLVLLLSLMLTACASQVAVSATEPPAGQTQAPPVVTVAPAETEAPAATEAPAETAAPAGVITDMDSLVAALEIAGATVEPGDAIEDSFFSAGGMFLKVNGQDVQVFEFPDEASREAAAGTIQANGFIIGQAAVDWIGQPYFFSAGNLIVLYVGSDNATLSLLESTLGQPLTR